MDNVQTRLQQATQLHQQQQYAAAEQIYRELLHEDPNTPDAWHLLGVMALQQSQYHRAQRYIQRANKLRPQGLFYHHLAQAYFSDNKFNQSLQAAAQAIQLEPKNAEHFYLLALYQQRLNMVNDTQSTLRAALPHCSDPKIHYLLAKNYREQRDYIQAEAHIRETLRLAPESAHYLTFYGQLKQELGDMPRAHELLRDAIAHNPKACQAYYLLSQSKQFDSKTDDDIKAMETLLEDESLKTMDQLTLHFALGKALDDCHQYKAAMGHFDKANALSDCHFDASGLADAVDTLETQYDAAFFSEITPSATPVEPRMIFIIGMPRSGTTLAERILSQPSQVFAGGERRTIGELMDHLRRQLKPGQSIHEKVRSLTEQQLTQLRAHYMKQLHSPIGCTVATDKMPMNFQYIGFMAKLFPEAKFVFCERDLRDVCLSCYFQHFEERPPFAYDLETLGHYANAFSSLMGHWQSVLGPKLYTLSYETLVSSPEKTTQALFEFCELPWTEKCLAFADNKRTERTASHCQIRQPLSDNRTARWKHYKRYIKPLLKVIKKAP